MTSASINGVDIGYRLQGPEGAPVVAFSNSLGAAMAMWDGVLPGVTGRYRCLTYDTRGHGSSGSADAAVTVDDLADDLAGLLDHLAIDKAHIVGLSLGGMTAQALGSRCPERVRSLTLMATAAYLPPQQFWNDRAVRVRAEGPEPIVETLLPRWFTAEFRNACPKIVDGLRQALLAVDRAGYARCCEAIGAMDLRSRLASIEAPTLVLAGALDPVTPPAMAEEIRAGMPAAELVVLPAVSHMLAVERPAAVLSHLTRFLDAIEGVATGNRPAFEAGLATRRAVLGDAHVERSMAAAGGFGAPWQDFITRYAWNEIWSDPALPRKTRSLLTLAITIALHREEEFKLHVRPALRNGVTAAELSALVRQAAVYAGVPAGNAAMRWLREVLGDELNGGTA